MKIDKDLILKLEKLARLSLTSEEKQIISRDLENIIDMVNKINELETDNTEPLRHITSQHIDPRKDEPMPFSDIESLLNQSPERKDSFFTIPKVVKK